MRFSSMSYHQDRVCRGLSPRRTKREHQRCWPNAYTFCNQSEATMEDNSRKPCQSQIGISRRSSAGARRSVCAELMQRMLGHAFHLSGLQYRSLLGKLLAPVYSGARPLAKSSGRRAPDETDLRSFPIIVAFGARRLGAFTTGLRPTPPRLPS